MYGRRYFTSLRCNIYIKYLYNKLRPRRHTIKSRSSDVIIPSKTRALATTRLNTFHSLYIAGRRGKGETHINNKIPIFARDSGLDTKLVIQIYTYIAIKATAVVNCYNYILHNNICTENDREVVNFSKSVSVFMFYIRQNVFFVECTRQPRLFVFVVVIIM